MLIYPKKYKFHIKFSGKEKLTVQDVVYSKINR